MPSHERGSPGWAIDYLKELGWSKQAAIALVANLMWESGGNRTNSIKWDAHGDRNHSHGAGQWNEKYGRAQALMAFAKERETDWDDPETQLLYMNSELQTAEHHTGNALRDALTLDEAMNAAINYWRPGVPHADRRKAIGTKLAEIYDVSGSLSASN